MNRIVKRNYPVEKLPKDLRDGLPRTGGATVTIEVTTESSFDRTKFLKDLEQARTNVGQPVTLDEAAQRIRSLRDEWDG